MAKTVAELQEEAKKKMKEKKNQSNDQNQPNELEELKSKNAFLEAKMIALEEQLSKSSSAEEEARLAQEAEALKKQEEALKQETEIQRILNEAIKEEPPTSDGEGSQISQKELVGVMAETVGKALDAQSKLTMGEMDKKLAESNKQITGLQKVVIDLLGSMSVERARGKFGAEFDRYSEEASKIHAANPTLTPEQSILLAKAEAESKQPAKEKVDSEKPNEPPAWTPDRPFSTESRESESSEISHRDSRRSFKKDLAAAVDEYLARR